MAFVYVRNDFSAFFHISTAGWLRQAPEGDLPDSTFSI
jgi:hypothetical protein